MTTRGDLMAFGHMRPQDQHIWVEFNGPNGAIVFYPNLSAN
eukprot:COSAG06_NODE_44749_length_361_cov_0.526718_1_plen_40_part_10